MSVTIAATPFLLLPAFISIAQSALVGATNMIKSGVEGSVIASTEYQEVNTEIKRLLAKNNGMVSQEIVELICREYDTVFVDRDVLVKTLVEHGAKNVSYEKDIVSAEMEGFILEFYKPEPTEEMAFPPYKMRITTKCSEEDLLALFENLSREYKMNSQEENYFKIKERLDKQNLKIIEEEVYDDDTIVLTVNID